VNDLARMASVPTIGGDTISCSTATTDATTSRTNFRPNTTSASRTIWYVDKHREPDSDDDDMIIYRTNNNDGHEDDHMELGCLRGTDETTPEYADDGEDVRIGLDRQSLFTPTEPRCHQTCPAVIMHMNSSPYTYSTKTNDEEIPTSGTDKSASDHTADDPSNKYSLYAEAFKAYWRGYLERCKGAGSNPLHEKPFTREVVADIIASMVIAFLGIFLVAVCNYKYVALTYEMPRTHEAVHILIPSLGAIAGIGWHDLFLMVVHWCSVMF
jgi:hypothetical protein